MKQAIHGSKKIQIGTAATSVSTAIHHISRIAPFFFFFFLNRSPLMAGECSGSRPPTIPV